MPHTNSRKSSGSKTSKKSPKDVRTKRVIVKDDDGWAHVVGGRLIKPDANKMKLEKGDFELNGTQYLNKTFDQIAKEYENFRKIWEQSDACKELIELVRPYAENNGVKNVVIMGLGSLQAMSGALNRTSYTQLAALITIMATLGIADIPVVSQDPAFTPLDEQFLKTLGHEVVADPNGFEHITENTLVYAIHCYPTVYHNVGKGPFPAMLIGNDLKEKCLQEVVFSVKYPAIEPMFSKFDSMFPLPRFRNDFSDTICYRRKDS